MFWPEVSEQQARTRLRTALWKIRTGFADAGVTILDQHPDWVGVSDGVELWVDTVEYRRIVATVDKTRRIQPDLLMQADELYRGDFLAGHYNDWVFQEQEHLRATQLDLMRRLMKVRESEGRYERALLLAQRVVAFDQLDEASHRDVMRLNAILRRPEEAQRAYRIMKGILRHEMGADPSAESSQLAADIARQAEGDLGIMRSSDTSRAPVFVARSRERSLLIERLETVRAGRGSVVLVEGPAGVGKTSLLNQVAEDAKWRNVEVVWGGYQDRSAEAFEGLRAAIEAALTPLRIQQLKTVVDDVWLEEASKILPSLMLDAEVRLRRRLSGDDARLRMYEALVQVLCGLATIYPTMVVLEDVHWADLDSLHVLNSLAARIADMSMTVVLTYRRDEMDNDQLRWPVMGAIDKHSVTTRTALSDLDEEAVAELLESIGGFRADLPLLAERLVRQTSGNPLFVVETLKSLRDLEPGETLPDQLPVADSVGDIVEGRLGRLGQSTTDVVAAAAVVARPMSVQQLAVLTGAPFASVLESVTTVVDREILNDHPDGLLFSHALVRRIAYRRIEPSRRTELHRAAAKLLEELGAAPAEIAHHYTEAHAWHEAAGWSYQAARAAEAVAAFDTAAAHYATALSAAESGDLDASVMWNLLVGWEHVADVLGDRAQQASLLDQMSALTSIPTRGAEYAERQARLLANTDRLADAMQMAQEGIGLDPDWDERLEVLTGQILVWSGDVRAAIAQVEKARREGNGSPEAHRVLGVAYAEVQQYTQAQEHLSQALEALQALEDAEGTAGVLSMMGTVYAEEGRFEEAVDALLGALGIARSIGFRKAEAECLVNLATIDAMSNRPSAALQLFDEAARAFSAIDHRRGSAIVQVNMASLLRDFVGDLEGAERLAAEAHEYFVDTGDFPRQATCEAVLAGVVAAGDPSEGIARYATLADELANHEADWLWRQVEESLIRLLLQEGRVDEARDRLDSLLSTGVLHDTNPAAVLHTTALEATVLVKEGQLAEAHDRARIVLDNVHAGTPDGYLLAHAAYEAFGSDPGRRADRVQAIELAHDLLAKAGKDLPESQQARSRSVPIHEAIEQAYRELVPRITSIDVSRRGKQSVKGNIDFITAEVTVYHPTDLEIPEPVERRRAQLKRVLGEIDGAGGQASIKVLAKLLGTSQATTKRDLAAIRRADA